MQQQKKRSFGTVRVFALQEMGANGRGQVVADQDGNKLIMHPYLGTNGAFEGKHFLVNPETSGGLKTYESRCRKDRFYYSIRVNRIKKWFLEQDMQHYQVSVGKENGIDRIGYVVFDYIVEPGCEPNLLFDDQDPMHCEVYELLNGVLRGAFEAALKRCDSCENEIKSLKWGVRAKDAVMGYSRSQWVKFKPVPQEPGDGLEDRERINTGLEFACQD